MEKSVINKENILNLKFFKNKINQYKIDIFGIIIAIIIYLLFAAYFSKFILDDAFISFRYSEHLANGKGLDWNFENDKYKNQGYSNFLWVILISLFIKYIDPIFLARLFSVLAGIGTFVTLNGINKYILLDEIKKYSSFFSIILACIPNFAIWTMGGLETIFFTFLIITGLYFWIKKNTTTSHNYVAQIFFSLAALTRLEGIIIFLTILFLQLIILMTDFKKFKNFKILITKSFIFFISIGIYFLFCYLYYNQFLPNSFYAKYSTGITLIRINNIIYVLGFIYFFIVLFFFLSLDILIVLYFKIKKKIFEWKELHHIIIIISSLIIMTQISPLMGYSFRFLIHLLPLLIISVVRVINVLYAIIENLIKKFYKFQKLVKFLNIIFNRVVLILLILTPICIHYQNLKSHYKRNTNNYNDIEWNYAIPLGKWLYGTFPSDTRIAANDCGAIPYYSKMWTYDLYGLNSKEVIFENFDMNYIKSLKIDIFILNSGSSKEFDSSGSHEKIHDSNYFQNNYYLILIIKADEKYYNLFIYIRNNFTLVESDFIEIPSNWIVTLNFTNTMKMSL